MISSIALTLGTLLATMSPLLEKTSTSKGSQPIGKFLKNGCIDPNKTFVPFELETIVSIFILMACQWHLKLPTPVKVALTGTSILTACRNLRGDQLKATSTSGMDKASYAVSLLFGQAPQLVGMGFHLAHISTPPKNTPPMPNTTIPAQYQSSDTCEVNDIKETVSLILLGSGLTGVIAGCAIRLMDNVYKSCIEKHTNNNLISEDP